MARLVPIFREATLADADAVAADIGAADAEELRLASGGLDPRAACRACLGGGGQAWAITAGGAAMGIFGTVPVSLLRGEAVVWAVLTRGATARPASLWRWSRPALALAAGSVGWADRLFNTVWARHATARRWLRRLGAVEGPPFAVPGGGGEMFVPFVIEIKRGSHVQP